MWQSGGWTQVLAAFDADPDGASPALASAAQAIRDSVARALEDSDEEVNHGGAAPDAGCRENASSMLWLGLLLVVYMDAPFLGRSDH